MDLKPQYSKFEGFFFDCDGVIWKESELLPGAKTVIDYILKNKFKLGFISNNSTKTISDYQKKFKNFGLDIGQFQIVTAIHATLDYLKSLNDSISNVFVIGESGLSQSLVEAGYSVVKDNNTDIHAVIVGMDRKFNYEKLSIGLQACLSGARFIATNSDPQFPTPTGIHPGAGGMVGALQYSLGREPEIICGKPNPATMNLMLKRYNLAPESVVMIGDRVSTDLESAKRAKIHPVLVKTGFGESEFRQYPNFPYYGVIESLKDLFD